MTATALPTDLMGRLRVETRPAHDATEAVPFSTAMVERRLPREFFVVNLHALHVVHRSLESHLAASSDPAVRAVWNDDLAKAPLLERDLRALAGEHPADTHPAMIAARAFVTDIEQSAASEPRALLGFLYVLEGSTLGGTILRQHLQAMYDIDEHTGLSYYWPYGNDVMPHWQQFKATMNAIEVTDADRDAIVDAARRAFAHIGAIMDAFTDELESVD